VPIRWLLVLSTTLWRLSTWQGGLDSLRVFRSQPSCKQHGGLQYELEKSGEVSSEVFKKTDPIFFKTHSGLTFSLFTSQSRLFSSVSFQFNRRFLVNVDWLWLSIWHHARMILRQQIAYLITPLVEALSSRRPACTRPGLKGTRGV
jgi:hypothetical protein